jgi:hypothetical protein
VPCRETDRYRIEQSPGVHLKDGLFVPNRNFHYFTGTPFKSRQSVLYDAKAKTIVNPFEHSLECVIVEDEGRYFMSSKIPSNAKATLQPVDPNRVPVAAADGSPALAALPPILKLLGEQSLDPAENVQLSAFPKSASAALNKPGVHYAAIMRENLPEMQPGLAIRDGRRCNIVVGVTDSSSEQTTATAVAQPAGGAQ